MTTIPDDMVERVARAICKSKTGEGVHCCQWPGNGGRAMCFAAMGNFDDGARAAIEAMQPAIPDDIMAAAGQILDKTLLAGLDGLKDAERAIANALLAAEKRGEERERERWEHVETVLFEIEQWCRAYPVKVFPEPDFTRAAELLAAGGMSLDAISASNMRHVLTSIEDNIAAIRQG